MGELLNTKVGEIRHGDILALIDELENSCPVGSRHFVGSQLLFFLTQCLYPDGPGNRRPITTELAISTPLLESRVGKLPDGKLRDLCGELALLAQEALEFYSGTKIYVLLNKTIPKQQKPKSSSVKQQRWDSVIRQRRSNR